MKQSVRR